MASNGTRIELHLRKHGDWFEIWLSHNNFANQIGKSKIPADAFHQAIEFGLKHFYISRDTADKLLLRFYLGRNWKLDPAYPNKLSKEPEHLNNELKKDNFPKIGKGRPSKAFHQAIEFGLEFFCISRYTGREASKKVYGGKNWDLYPANPDELSKKHAELEQCSK